VRDGGAGDRVKKENFRPGCGATFWRVDLDFSEYFVKRGKISGLIGTSKASAAALNCFLGSS
jgi:hypothetical protein